MEGQGRYYLVWVLWVTWSTVQYWLTIAPQAVHSAVLV